MGRVWNAGNGRLPDQTGTVRRLPRKARSASQAAWACEEILNRHGWLVCASSRINARRAASNIQPPRSNLVATAVGTTTGWVQVIAAHADTASAARRRWASSLRRRAALRLFDAVTHTPGRRPLARPAARLSLRAVPAEVAPTPRRVAGRQVRAPRDRAGATEVSDLLPPPTHARHFPPKAGRAKRAHRDNPPPSCRPQADGQGPPTPATPGPRPRR